MGHVAVPSAPVFSFEATRKTVQTLLRASRVTVTHMEDLTGHLHRLRVVHLSNGKRLMLKINPPTTTSLLRHESHYLENEASLLDVLAKSNMPIPRKVKYDRRSIHFGAPFLLTTHVPGTCYADAVHHLTRAERQRVESQLRSLRSIISQRTSPTFGPAGLVKSQKGCKAWREAFTTMLESVLMDGEDALVNLPYHQIRDALSKWGSSLDDVQEANLLVLELGQPENVFIDRKTCEVTGLLDFGYATWGDLGMMEPESCGRTKELLYTCYHSAVTIVRNHYRPKNGDAKELEARRVLTKALGRLAAESK